MTDAELAGSLNILSVLCVFLSMVMLAATLFFFRSRGASMQYGGFFRILAGGFFVYFAVAFSTSALSSLSMALAPLGSILTTLALAALLFALYRHLEIVFSAEAAEKTNTLQMVEKLMAGSKAKKGK